MRKDSSGRGANVRQRAGSLTPARRLAGLAAVAVALLFLGLPTVARADMEASEEAPVLVEQAIALIANDTGPARVAERIDDTLKAPRKEGVDLALVGRALAVVERPGHHKAALGEARALLVKDVALLALALAAVAFGLWLSVRLRPPHSIRELERRSAEKEGRGR
ncbi:hypothetical protein ACFCYM_13980 [Streptomyces sp. NPDC056254]|uniref:hypothetical protein n=1 Tax=Streptomyces sp. NPDC056254 TaxID=3345763 RepID=UPI0035DACC45